MGKAVGALSDHRKITNQTNQTNRGEKKMTNDSNKLQQVANPYETNGNLSMQSVSVEMANPVMNMGNHSTSVSAAAEVARVQAQMFMAKQFPRDEKVAADKILNAFSRPSLAQVAMYEYARGGNPIADLSIRAAEQMVLLWGNCDVGIKEISRKGNESEVEAYCWDMDANVRSSQVFTVPHYRDTKRGRQKLEDARDIYELVANMAARRLRARILAIIPRDVQDAVKDQIAQTMQANFQITPEYIKGILKAFDDLGVSKGQIENFFQRRIESITPAQSVRLNTIYNSIRDGMSRPEEWFGVDDSNADKGGGSGKPTLEDLAKQAKAKDGKDKREPAQSQASAQASAQASKPTTKKADQTARSLEFELANMNAPVSEQDVQEWCNATGQMFVPDLIIDDLKNVVNAVLDWQEAHQQQ